MIQYISKTK